MQQLPAPTKVAEAGSFASAPCTAARPAMVAGAVRCALTPCTTAVLQGGSKQVKGSNAAAAAAAAAAATAAAAACAVQAARQVVVPGSWVGAAAVKAGVASRFACVRTYLTRMHTHMHAHPHACVRTYKPGRSLTILPPSWQGPGHWHQGQTPGWRWHCVRL